MLTDEHRKSDTAASSLWRTPHATVRRRSVRAPVSREA